MSKLEFVNRFFFQLFFVRLTRVIENKDDEVKYQWYSIMFWVVPFTGWNTNFKFIGKRHLKQITKSRNI